MPDERRSAEQQPGAPEDGWPQVVVTVERELVPPQAMHLGVQGRQSRSSHGQNRRKQLALDLKHWMLRN
jgi:hypothetical protein